MPCDEDERTRMEILHSVYLYVLGGRLTTAPLENPTKILDVGTGCGDWAIAMGEEYPEAEVIGTDIAKIQPTAVPMNVFFEIDDAEEEFGWTYADDSFDLVHFRTMMGAFKDVRALVSEYAPPAFEHLYSYALHLIPIFFSPAQITPVAPQAFLVRKLLTHRWSSGTMFTKKHIST